MLIVRLFRRLLALFALPAALFALWWYATEHSTNYYVPPLRSIIDRFRPVWTAARLRSDVLPSVLRLVVGYLLASLIAVGVGILVGTNPRLRMASEPALEFLRAIPPPVLVPVIMLFSGIGNTMKVLVIASGCLWPVLLNTVAGVRAVDEVLSDTCRSYGITGRARLWHLVLPSAGPQIVTGMRQALSIGIILMVISEMFAASNGLGFTIIGFQRSFAITDMWTGILLLGLLGLAASLVFSVAERTALTWYNGLRDAQKRQ
jgi:ABC-type nitrate/sulfonate/bicarbonate transport system permease component